MTILRVHARQCDWKSSRDVVRHMLDRKAELDSLVLNVAFATGIAADQVPDEFTWCNKDGVNYCTESRNQHIPSPTEWTLDSEAAYVHFCANETMHGVEIHYTPDVGKTPLVGDMSSNFMSKPNDVRKHACIYAGLQKNAGPSVMAVNIIRGDFPSGACRLHQHVRTWLIAQASRSGMAPWRWLESPDDYVKGLYVSSLSLCQLKGGVPRDSPASFQRTW